LETTYLRTLLETVAKGSVSGAAERLFVTPSAVSRRIKFLEDLCGCPLLDRSGPVLKSTEAGRLVLEKAVRILAIEKDLMGELRGIGERQCVSFSCTPGFGVSYLPQILKSFTAADGKPGNVDLRFGAPEDVIRQLKEHIVEFAVLHDYAALDLSEYDAYSLPDEEMIFVSAPGLGIRPGTVGLDTLQPHTLFFRSAKCCSRLFLEENLRRTGKDINVFGSIITCEDLQVLLRAVAEMGGIAYLPRSVARERLRHETLRHHSIDGFSRHVKQTLVVWKGRRLDMRRTAFLKAIFAAFSMEMPQESTAGK